MSDEIGAVLYDIDGGLPPELCRIIADYAIEWPYTWNAVRFSDFVSCRSIDNRTTELIVRDRISEANVWHTFVSNISIGECAHAEWTIEFDNPSKAKVNGRGWIGFGVTTSTTNHISAPDCGFSKIAGRDDWIVYACDNRWQLMHNDRQESAFWYPFNAPDRLRVWFLADPSTGTVRIRYRAKYAHDDVMHPYGRKISNTAFWQLRPAVVLAGPITAIVRSGPPVDAADWPADCRDAFVVVADR